MIRPGHFTLEQLQAVHAGGVALEIDAEARAAIAASAAVVQRAAAGDAPVYGVNTGFGKLASTRISAADLATLQLNLIRSHSVGRPTRHCLHNSNWSVRYLRSLLAPDPLLSPR